MADFVAGADRSRGRFASALAALLHVVVTRLAGEMAGLVANVAPLEHAAVGTGDVIREFPVGLDIEDLVGGGAWLGIIVANTGHVGSGEGVLIKAGLGGLVSRLWADMEGDAASVVVPD